MRLRLLDRWKLWRWRTAGLVVTEQACRRCGDAVRGLETMTCPECGANRYRVGTIGPLRPLVQPWQAWVALWCFAVIVFAIAADPLLLNCLPRTLTYQEDYVLQPHSKLYGPLPFRRIGHSFGWPGLGPYAKSPSVVGTSATLINIPAFGEQFETVIDIDPQTKRGSCGQTARDPARSARICRTFCDDDSCLAETVKRFTFRQTRRRAAVWATRCSRRASAHPAAEQLLGKCSTWNIRIPRLGATKPVHPCNPAPFSLKCGTFPRCH